jgi:hypothetical protein
MTEPDPVSDSRFGNLNRFHRYLLIVLGGLVVYIVVAATINFHFDPWTIYRPLREKVVPRETNLERVTVAHDLRRADKIDVLLLGSSRVRYMLARHGGEVDKQASAPFFGDRHAYAAGMAGTNIHVMRRVFEHALHYHPIEHLVFLLDDVMLNAYRPLGPGWNEANYYGSPNYQTSLERAMLLEQNKNKIDARDVVPAIDLPWGGVARCHAAGRGAVRFRESNDTRPRSTF